MNHCAPDACTLPAAEQPARLAEFDELFATALRGQERLSPTRLRWQLDPAAARDLLAREQECCSFFTFHFGVDGVEVEVPGGYVGVLDALAERAGARL